MVLLQTSINWLVYNYKIFNLFQGEKTADQGNIL